MVDLCLLPPPKLSSDNKGSNSDCLFTLKLLPQRRWGSLERWRLEDAGGRTALELWRLEDADDRTALEQWRLEAGQQYWSSRGWGLLMKAINGAVEVGGYW